MEEEYIKNIKKLYREKTNIIIILLVINALLILFLLIFSIHSSIKINKKVDYRYFNINRTIEELNNVRIDTYDGSIKSGDYR